MSTRMKTETPPLPTPRTDEEQDDFVSRCISWVADESPNTPADQRTAMCFDQWRESKGEIAETDKTEELLKQLGFIKVHPHLESFEWVPEIVAKLPEGARLYKVKCIRSGYTYHVDRESKQYKRVFSDDELHQNGRSLAAAKAAVNLDHFQTLDGEAFVIDSEFNTKEHDLEAVIYVKDSYFNELYDNNHIVGASVEYSWRNELPVDGALEQIGVIFNGLAAVTDRFGDPPASPYTSVERFLTMYNKSHRNKGVTTKMSEKAIVELGKRLTGLEAEVKANALVVKTLQEDAEKDEHGCTTDQVWDEEAQKCVAKPSPEEVFREITEIHLEHLSDEVATLKECVRTLQFADLPDADFACIIGEGDEKERKLPMPDCDHVQNAMSRYNQTEGCQTTEVRVKICDRARKCDMEAAFEEGGFCETQGEAFMERIKKFLVESKHILNKFAEIDKQLQETPMTTEQIKARIEDLAKARSGLEEQLYPEPPENEAQIRADLEVIWAEIYALEEALTVIIAGATSTKTETSGRKGISASGEGSDGEPKISPELEETWKKREEKAKRFKESPLKVT